MSIASITATSLASTTGSAVPGGSLPQLQTQLQNLQTQLTQEQQSKDDAATMQQKELAIQQQIQQVQLQIQLQQQSAKTSATSNGSPISTPEASTASQPGSAATSTTFLDFRA